jgi:hypothetical protein
LGENSHAGLVSVAIEAVEDGGGDVVAGCEMTGPDDVVGQRAVDEDFGMALDECLNLGLPLFGPDEVGRCEQREDFLGAGRGAEELIEMTSGGDTFAAFAGQDQGAAWLKDAGAGAHPFDALVEVKVEGIAAVGRDHNLERRFDLLHGGMADEFVSDLVGVDEVAGKGTGNLSLLIERDIEKKARAGTEGDVAKFFPQRVAVGDAECGAGIADMGRAMIAHDGFKTGTTRHDALGPATESGEEMGFDEAGDNA